jgi:hypothetical protein
MDGKSIGKNSRLRAGQAFAYDAHRINEAWHVAHSDAQTTAAQQQ